MSTRLETKTVSFLLTPNGQYILRIKNSPCSILLMEPHVPCCPQHIHGLPDEELNTSEHTMTPKNFAIVLVNLLTLTLVLCGCSTQGEPGGQSVSEVGSPRPGEVRMNLHDGERYVWIPGGSFQMGCSSDDRYCQDEADPRDANEKTPHRVTISKGYWMGQTEVTIGAYRKYVQATRAKTPEELVLAAPERFRSPDFPQGDNHPMVYVTWEEAAQYCQWAVADRGGMGVRGACRELSGELRRSG